MGASRNFATNQSLSIDTGIITAAPLTMACWFNPDDITTRGYMMQLVDKDVANMWFALFAGGDIGGDPIVAQALDAGGDRRASTSSGYSAGAWQHACGVYTSATSRDAYLNAGSVGSNTTSTTPAGIDRFAIGRALDSTPSNPFFGKIAHAAIWNVALSVAEIMELARGVLPPRIRPSSLKGYWPIWGIDSPELDKSGQGNSLTVNSATEDVSGPPVKIGSGFSRGFDIPVAAGGDAVPQVWSQYRIRRG